MNISKSSYLNEKGEMIDPIRYFLLHSFLPQQFSEEKIHSELRNIDPVEYAALRFQMEDLLDRKDLSCSQFLKLSGSKFASDEEMYAHFSMVLKWLIAHESPLQAQLWKSLLQRDSPTEHLLTRRSEAVVATVPYPLKQLLEANCTSQDWNPEAIANGLKTMPKEENLLFREQLIDAIVRGSLSVEQISFLGDVEITSQSEAKRWLAEIWEAVYPGELVPQK